MPATQSPQKRKRTPSKLPWLRYLGFDLSRRSGVSYRVSCSCCAALTIQGVPCHETGCQNAKHECKGCNALLDAGEGRYCPDCL